MKSDPTQYDMIVPTKDVNQSEPLSKLLHLGGNSKHKHLTAKDLISRIRGEAPPTNRPFSKDFSQMNNPMGVKQNYQPNLTYIRRHDKWKPAAN